MQIVIKMERIEFDELGCTVEDLKQAVANTLEGGTNLSGNKADGWLFLDVHEVEVQFVEPNTDTARD